MKKKKNVICLFRLINVPTVLCVHEYIPETAVGNTSPHSIHGIGKMPKRLKNTNKTNATTTVIGYGGSSTFSNVFMYATITSRKKAMDAPETANSVRCATRCSAAKHRAPNTRAADKNTVTEVPSNRTPQSWRTSIE